MNNKLNEKVDNTMKDLGYEIKIDRTPYFDTYYAVRENRKIFLRNISNNEKKFETLQHILLQHEAYDIIESTNIEDEQIVAKIKGMEISDKRTDLEEQIFLLII